MKQNNTSWQKVSKWYNKTMNVKGQHNHENIIMPKALNLLNLTKNDTVLDLGCGQGVLSRAIKNRDVKYLGIDLSFDLIKFAKKSNRNENHQFIVEDMTKPLNLNQKFTKGTIILALQNVSDWDGVIHNFNKYITQNGKLLIVINHPYFRTPRLTGWGIDAGNNKQYRKVYAYMSEQKVPVDLTPGGEKRTVVWSFHYPLETLTKILNKNGFTITTIEEWASDRQSEGKYAKRENNARNEFPLFMSLLCSKI